jgi:hypothetical protein
MTLQHVLLFLFTAIMACNVIALVRHYMVLRVLIISLNGFIEQQKQLSELMDHDRRRATTIAPE